MGFRRQYARTWLSSHAEAEDNRAQITQLVRSLVMVTFPLSAGGHADTRISGEYSASEQAFGY